MKKLAVLLMTMLLVVSISTTTYAANPKVTVSDDEAQCTQMAYLTVSLEDCKKANTLGISMDYDSSILTKVTSECVWAQEGILQEFDVASNTGVWATKKAENLNGDICTLAFRVKPDAPVGDAKVTCEVIVKNNSKEIGTYTAVGTVRIMCEHSYGEWMDKNSDVHKRICKYCESEETTIHIWNVGEVIQKPTETENGWKLYHCSDCGAEKKEAITIQDEFEQDKPLDSEQPDGNDLNTPSDTIKEPSKIEESNNHTGSIISWLSNLGQNSNRTDTEDTHIHSDMTEEIEGEKEPDVLSDSEGVTEHIHSEDCDHSNEDVDVDTEHVDVTDSHHVGYLIVAVIAIIVAGLLIFVYKKKKDGR